MSGLQGKRSNVLTDSQGRPCDAMDELFECKQRAEHSAYEVPKVNLAQLRPDYRRITESFPTLLGPRRHGTCSFQPCTKAVIHTSVDV
jgi:hypothetical protein